MSGHSADNDAPRKDHLRFKVIDVLHGLRCRGVVLHASDGILCLLCGKEWGCPCCDAPSRPVHVMNRHGRVALHAPDCWCRAERGPNDRQWVAEHLDECAECRGDEQHAAPTVTCDDLGCVDGRTVQGRKYHYDDSVEEQWAPCGRRADTCPIPPGEPR